MNISEEKLRMIWQRLKENETTMQEMQTRAVELEEQSVGLYQQTCELENKTREMEAEMAQIRSVNELMWDFIETAGLIDALEQFAGGEIIPQIAAQPSLHS